MISLVGDYFFWSPTWNKKESFRNGELIEVEILKGIQTGENIYEKKGDIQTGKERRGDLLIGISGKSHSIWKEKILDIYSDLSISLDEWLFGQILRLLDL